MNALLPQAQGDLPLRDIHLPPDPPWWPPAPGWWVLFVLACASLVAGYLLYRRMRQARIWKEQIQAEIRQLSARHGGDDSAYAAALHQLLRRAALRYAADAHHLQGEPWRQVLAQIPVDAATLDALMALEASMYQPRARYDRAAAEDAVRRWLHAAWPRVKRTEPGHA